MDFLIPALKKKEEKKEKQLPLYIEAPTPIIKREEKQEKSEGGIVIIQIM